MDTAFLLIKIPCLLLATASIHICSRSPTPRQNVRDGAVIKSFGEKIMRVVSTSILYWVGVLWIVALAESAVIITRTFPSLSISDFILCKGTDGSKIRLTNATALAVPLVMAAAVIRLWCFCALGKHFTFELTIHKDHTLVTTGPYSIVRHPSYTGITMISIGIYLLHGTRGSWVRECGLMDTSALLGRFCVYSFIAYTIAGNVSVVRRMKEEDRELQLRFGRQWDDWAARVPNSLVPGIF